MTITYTESLANAICERLIAGESMRQIGADPEMPSRDTMLRWLASNEDFAAKCARARPFQADFVHEEMVDIEADVLEGKIDPNVARVVLGSKQWRAGRLAPKKYGDKTIISGDPERPLMSVSTQVTKEEFKEEIKALLEII